MIESLTIRDFALVERLTLEFSEGFTALTGETGAGKSILLQALGLLLGDRASRELVRTGAEQARVEGIFIPRGPAQKALRAIVEEAGLPWEEPLIVARTVTADGKSRAFVNGAAAGLSVLAALGAHLVEVSSQHQHQALLAEEGHAGFLDAALDEEGRQALAAYREAHEAHASARAEVDRLTRLESASEERRDFLTFQLQEMRSAELKEGEDEALAAEQSLLVHAEKLTEAYSRAEEALYSGADCALDLVGRAQRSLEKAQAFDPEAAPALASLAEAGAALEEAGAALRKRLGAVRADPRRLEEVGERLERLRRLTRKHGGSVAAALLALERLERELYELDHRQSVLEDAKAVAEAARAALEEVAARLTKARREAARRLEADVGVELEALGLARAAFRVELSPVAPGPGGAEAVRFLFAPNLGEEPRPLARIASGGELSRVLLAVKNALRDASVETLIFDEVDAGIGGQVADRVGDRLRLLARDCQVVCVTHLPQIASRAPAHQRVEKVSREGRTLTQVRLLTPPERVEEFCRMLGGDGQKDGAAYAHARELAERSAT